MAEQVCVCPQCGKKYKLKEGFDAKSFSCKACGATVWVAGKPPAPAPTSRKSAAGGAPSPRKAGRAAAAAPARGARRSRDREEEHAQEEEGGRRGRSRHQKPKSNANVLMAVGGVALIGIVIAVIVMSGKDDGKGQQSAGQPPAAGTGGAGMAAADAPVQPEVKQPDPAAPEPAKATPERANPEPKKPDTPPDDAPSPEGGEKPTKLGGGEKKPSEGGLGKNDPPATLGHLDSTPPEVRKQIDELIAVMFDHLAGRDSQIAKTKLAAIGKPAFLPILGKMAAIRDTITDVDSQEEKDMESSLMLADGCLREMDGFLEASGKQIIRPGTDKKYIKYILVLHYRRWNDGLGGGTPLKDMPEMPGAFDPSKLPQEEDEEEAGK